jgi:hypothetical protein
MQYSPHGQHHQHRAQPTRDWPLPHTFSGRRPWPNMAATRRHPPPAGRPPGGILSAPPSLPSSAACLSASAWFLAVASSSTTCSECVGVGSNKRVKQGEELGGGRAGGQASGQRTRHPGPTALIVRARDSGSGSSQEQQQ